jgi:hypothetical protein
MLSAFTYIATIALLSLGLLACDGGGGGGSGSGSISTGTLNLDLSGLTGRGSPKPRSSR